MDAKKRKLAREAKDSLGPSYQANEKRGGGGDLRRPLIHVMQSAEHRLGDDPSWRVSRNGERGRRIRAGRLLIQASMRPSAIVIINELIHDLL